MKQTHDCIYSLAKSDRTCVHAYSLQLTIYHPYDVVVLQSAQVFILAYKYNYVLVLYIMC